MSARFLLTTGNESKYQKHDSRQSVSGHERIHEPRRMIRVAHPEQSDSMPVVGSDNDVRVRDDPQSNSVPRHQKIWTRVLSASGRLANWQIGLCGPPCEQIGETIAADNAIKVQWTSLQPFGCLSS